jgi:hypothetical protein
VSESRRSLPAQRTFRCVRTMASTTASPPNAR